MPAVKQNVVRWAALAFLLGTTSATVHAEIARLTDEGLFTDEEVGTTCCFANQDKVWVTGPAGEKWEIYTVLADSDTFGASPAHAATDTANACC